jgi:microsomal epoxide hydrolase
MFKRAVFTGLAALVLLLASGLAGGEKNWKDASVQVGDIRIHYLEGGSGDRHIVFLPGLAMPKEVWKEQIPYFTARGFHVIAIDPRSQGLTTKTEGGNTYHQWAADLHAFLVKMKLEHCTLVGWSAAVVALLEYVSSSETLQPDRLVFVDGTPAGLTEKDYPGGITLQQAREGLLALQEDRTKFTEARVRGLFKIRQPEHVYKEIFDGSMKTPAGAALALLFDQITGDRRPVLAQITVPTLIVAPQEKQLLGEYLKSKISGAQLSVIPDVGHALFLEKPQSFNQALEEFLGNK